MDSADLLAELPADDPVVLLHHAQAALDAVLAQPDAPARERAVAAAMIRAAGAVQLAYVAETIGDLALVAGDDMNDGDLRRHAWRLLVEGDRLHRRHGLRVGRYAGVLVVAGTAA